VAAAKIVVVWKSSVAISFFVLVESGMLRTNARCNVSVLQLNWYHIPKLVACELIGNLQMTTFGTSDYMFTTM
jgi:hypothetical protein